MDRFTFGGRMPWAIGLLLALTVVTSLTVAFGDRHAGPGSLFQLVALVPVRVLHGHVWRLLTWGLVETSPLGLLFACLFLYWFGRDLADDWGSRRFLTVYGAVAVAASAGTCLIALIDHDVMPQTFLGSWALACAVIVAWGLWFPDRITRLFFVLSISGYWLAWLVIALTIAYAIYSGWEHYLPILLAEGAMLVWLFRRSFRARWTRWSRARTDGARKAREAEVLAKRRATVTTLKKIEASEEEEDLPPLPKEIEAILGLGPKDDKGERGG
jgi:membrane associated rhomboid family serine protease